MKTKVINREKVSSRKKKGDIMDNSSKLKEVRLIKAIKEAQKDPKIMAEIRKFIKITTGSYKLKDYGMEKIGLE